MVEEPGKRRGLGTKHLVKLWVESADEPITATANHPVWIDGRGWTDAENIGIGDRVLLPGGRTASIRPVRDLGQIAGQLVYNLTVSRFHTYTVVTGGTPIVVHNANCLHGRKPGSKFTQAGKKEVIAKNKEKYGGRARCEECKVTLVTPKRPTKGSKHNCREIAIDDKTPKSKGGYG
ncbi:polymorphic toxin-type HINT domain-containing protein [Goodfellowiella coeruleoviolacea]|uniref:polymorphic toxin-type HINT domain-containing protein n=1 Tax=Goodfellowiella coeruleoviolacea TaxID=334858 RepID=UPI00389956ED